MRRGTHQVPSPPSSALEELCHRSQLAVTWCLGSSLEPELAAWSPLHPIFPARSGALPGLAHASQPRALREPFVGVRKHVPRRARGVVLYVQRPWTGKRLHTSLLASRDVPTRLTGSGDLHPVGRQCLGDLRDPVVGAGVSISLGALSASPAGSASVCCPAASLS